MKYILTVALVASCVPPSDPIGARPQYAQQPAYGQPPPGQPGYQPPAGQPTAGQPQQFVAGSSSANCSANLQCYDQCGVGQACLDSCDQRSNPQAAQLSRAVIGCIVQSGCTDQPCVEQRCAIQLQSCAGNAGVASTAPSGPAPVQPVAAAPPTAQGGFDLVYRWPGGFTEQRTPDLIKLTKHEQVQTGTDFYGTRDYQYLILPTVMSQGSMLGEFQAQWTALIKGSFPGDATTPNPRRRRLQSGFTCLFDGANEKSKAGGDIDAVLYLIFATDRYVPILAIHWGDTSWDFEKQLAPAFNAMTIRGGSPNKTSLNTAPDLVGDWSTSDASYGSYVNSSGGYVGDASIGTASYLTLKANGTFTSTFIGVTSSRHIKEQGAGTWKVDDEILVLNDTKQGRTDKRRIIGVSTNELELAPSNAESTAPEFMGPRRPAYNDKFKRK